MKSLQPTYNWRTSVVFLLAFAAALVIQAAVPFVTLPTLGQAVWSTGFAQSLAGQPWGDFHATAIGAPKPAAIAFGLAAVYPQSLFIRIGLHPADAYTLVFALWFFVAYWGGWRVALQLGVPSNLATLASVLWLSSPLIWAHSDYSMLSLGIALLPFYFFAAFELLTSEASSAGKRTQTSIFYCCTAVIAIFMDGYSFMMFALGSSIILVYALAVMQGHRRGILLFCLPVHFLSFAISYVLFALFIGKTQFATSDLDFFRAWGADLNYLTVPTTGVHFFWDAVNVGVTRKAENLFGDASVWTTSFCLPIALAGIVGWAITRKYSTWASCFLLLALSGLYLSLGPALKFNVIKPEGVSTALMAAKYAGLSTGSGWLSENLPGFNSMRASYRWLALGVSGFWLLIVLAISRLAATGATRLASVILAAAVVISLPHVDSRFARAEKNRSTMFQMESELMADLERVVEAGDKLAFLPYRNDMLANFIAPLASLTTFNIGGDKNLSEARNHWPDIMRNFAFGAFDEHFAPRVALFLASGEADVVAIPHIDLLQAAHAWPAEFIFKEQTRGVARSLERYEFLEVEERRLFTFVSLKERQGRAALYKYLISQTCIVPQSHCLGWDGVSDILSLVGERAVRGMRTDGRPGYLIYGPYKKLTAGEFRLRVFGEITRSTNPAIIDIVGREEISKFLVNTKPGHDDSPGTGLILDEKVMIPEDEFIEVRVFVHADSDIVIEGYTLISTSAQ